MHPEADAFLDAIFDHPDDDTPRLVYADWLQEHGQENYAQFIRLQCAAAREKLWSDEANRLWEEIGRVWNRLRYEWWPATVDVWQLPGLDFRWDAQANKLVYFNALQPLSLDAVHFHRGLLRSDIPFTADQAVRYSDFWPSIMTSDASLMIDGPPGTLTALTSNPILSHVRRIQFDTDWFNVEAEPVEDALSGFLRSRYLCRARFLDLLGLYLDSAVIETLLTANNLSSVEGIQLSAKTDGVMASLRNRFKRVNEE
jgi:uncharacterized protein (TIGR02996 family)